MAFNTLTSISVTPLVSLFLVPMLPPTANLTSASYALTQDYSGAAFYSGFQFATIPDPTNGHVVFVDENTANATGLAGFLQVNNNSSSSNDTSVTANPVYLGVDATTVLPISQGRNATRVFINQTWNHALVIADIQHMPGGICGVWPAFWMLGTSSTWPNAGEIDIVEGVNTQSFNRMTLHTSAGVAVTNDSTLFSGEMITADCDVNDPDQDRNAGCQIADQSTLASFGAGFNANGGGVFAMEWTGQFIKIWFFPRNDTPADVLTANPDPSLNGTWGTPNAWFKPNPTNSSVIDDHFCELQIVFDTTFCGDWAGRTWNTTSTCASLAPTCGEYVSTSPTAFADAYWAINSLRVFQDSNLASYDNATLQVVPITRRNQVVRRW